MNLHERLLRESLESGFGPTVSLKTDPATVLV